RVSRCVRRRGKSGLLVAGKPRKSRFGTCSCGLCAGCRRGLGSTVVMRLGLGWRGRWGQLGTVARSMGELILASRSGHLRSALWEKERLEEEHERTVKTVLRMQDREAAQ